MAFPKFICGLTCVAFFCFPRFSPPLTASQPISAGPLFDQFSLTLDIGNRWEALGPFWSVEKKAGEHLLSLCPLFSRFEDEVADSTEIDFLYPLITYDRYGPEYRFQIVQLFSFSGGRNQLENKQKRFTLFPIYFQQRSPDPSLNYTALLPFYGHLKNRLFRDEINFVMLPIYLQTRKKDVVTDNYLFPIFHLRQGTALRGWQFWPLLGEEVKGITTITNSLDEVETIPGHKKRFVLWPFFFHHELGIGSDNPKRINVLLPFYSLERSPLRDSSTYLWPFFTFTNDREKKYREFDFIGPLGVFARGEGKTGNRVWPLFSRVQSKTLMSQFYLWPVYKYNEVNAPPLKRERTRVLFFLYSDVTEKNTETSSVRRRTDLWPLFTTRRDWNGSERLQFLAPVESLFPNNKSIERNYSPLWSIWRSEKNGKTGATSQSLLWNLYRRQTTPERKKCSLLFGLFQYQSGPEGNHMRLFYIPVTKHKQAGATRPEP